MSNRRWIRAALQNTALAVFGLVLALVAGELLLRVYNPFGSRVRGYAILLPISKRYAIDNPSNDKLDRKIIHTTNSLGFRGAEPPAYPDSSLTILTIGGSTTECVYLSDGQTWTDELERELGRSFRPMWINNAGFDGHSTFGHLVLLDSIVRMRVKPKAALFLLGVNDIGHEAPTALDTTLYRRYSVRKLWRGAVTHSELLGLGVDIYRYSQARRRGLVQGEVFSIAHLQIDLRSANRRSVSAREGAEMVEEHRGHYVPAYAERVRQLVQRSRANGIEPILITQPMLLGSTVDSVTGVDLSDLVWSSTNGATIWKVLELYNDAVRREGKKDDVLVVDLARELPKSSLYYYDYVHFTSAGAELAGKIISREVCPFLSSRYPEYRAGACGADSTLPTVAAR